MRTALAEVKHKETGEVICNLSELTDDVLRGIDLSEAALSGVELSGIDFHGGPQADLYSTNPKPTRPSFCRADLSYANLSNSRLCYANLEGANLSHANLQGTDFYEAILSGADLRGANLTEGKLHRAFLSGAKYDAATQWPKDFLRKGQKLEHFGLVLVQDEKASKEAEERAVIHRRHVQQERLAKGLCQMCGQKINLMDGILHGKRQHKTCTEFKE